MGGLWQDVRFGLRMLAKSRGVTVVALVTLALGIGVNTAVFSVVHGILLRPLPYPEPDRLAMVYMATPERDFWRSVVSPPLYRDWRDRNEVFAHLATYRINSHALTGMGEPAQIRVVEASVNFFEVFRVAPLLGRTFRPGEDSPGQHTVLVLSHAFWQRQFGGDPDIVGKTVTLTGTPFTIIGVMPPGREFPAQYYIPEGWAPLNIPPRQDVRTHYFLSVVGRLKDGISLAQARAGMDTLSMQLQQEFPRNLKGRVANVVPLHEDMVGNVRPTLLVLSGAVGFLLLIACANVANLLLARAAARQREMAIRAALGARRGQLIRQLLTESVLLAGIGGVLGVLVAWGCVRMFVAFAPSNIPLTGYVSLDMTVLGFTLGVSVLTGVLFGMAPAWQASRADVNQSLKEGARSGAGGFRLLGHHRPLRRMNSLLVILETSLALVLLVGAGLLVRSFWLLMAQDTGFQPERLVMTSLSLPTYKYSTADQRRMFYEQLVERTSALPGVRSAAVVNALPFSNWDWQSSVRFENKQATDADDFSAGQRVISPGYFATLGIPLLTGRDFAPADAGGAPLVAIVDEAFVRKFFPKEDPLGRRIGMSLAEGQWQTIVGVVGRIRHGRLNEEYSPNVYLPFAQQVSAMMMVVARVDGRPAPVLSAIRGEVRRLDPHQPIIQERTADALIAASVAPQRFFMILLALFGSTAVILAGVGIYGVMAYNVTQRTHEIGIRMALGAHPGDVLRLVLGQGAALALMGLAIGAVGALWATQVLKTFLFSIQPTDTVTFVVVVALLGVIALAACLVPARRATKVDPMVALRYE